MRTSTLWNWVRRIRNLNPAGSYVFRLPSGKVVYLRDGLRALREYMDGLDTYEARVVRDSIWSSHPQLKSLADAVRNPVDT